MPCITRSQKSQEACEPLKLKHFHYTTWPDHGVPTHPSSLVKFVQQVRKEYKDSTAPMVVHCRWVWLKVGVAVNVSSGWCGSECI